MSCPPCHSTVLPDNSKRSLWFSRGFTLITLGDSITH